MSLENSGTGFEQSRLEVRILYPYPPKPVLATGQERTGQSSEVNQFFVLKERRTRNYFSECNELMVPEDSSLMGFGLDSSAVKQKS